MQIHWFPGHIAKAQRQLKERIKAVDAVIEMVDARLPMGTHFRFVDELVGNRKRILVVNKTDLAPSSAWQKAVNGWKAKGIPTVGLYLPKRKGLIQLKKQLAIFAAELEQKMKTRGRLPRRLRLMVVGLPNVGKSSLINALVDKRTLKVANKPGVTRQMQWISIGNEWELLDTPGVIPLKLEDQTLALKLALIGSVSEQAYDPERAARMALDLLRQVCPGFLQETLGQENLQLEDFGKARHFIRSGGVIDTERAARIFFSEFRTGRMGSVFLEAGF